MSASIGSRSMERDRRRLPWHWKCELYGTDRASQVVDVIGAQRSRSDVGREEIDTGGIHGDSTRPNSRRDSIGSERGQGPARGADQKSRDLVRTVIGDIEKI